MIPDLAEVLVHYPEFSGVHPACTAVPSIDAESFGKLVESIEEYGLEEPITRLGDGRLIDGRTRLLACYVANQDIRTVDLPDNIDPWQFVAVKNIQRRHLSAGQKAKFGLAMLAAAKEAAKERMKLSQGRGKKGVETLPPVKSKARDEVGKAVGTSGRSIDKAAFVQEWAPDLMDAVGSDDMSLDQAYSEARVRKVNQDALPVEKPPKKPKADKQQATTTIFTASGKQSQIPLPEKVVFNKTHDSVDWARWTWNPVTGCEHGCSFCYAREIANQKRMEPYYPNKFEPTYHPYRLQAPSNTKPPDSTDSRDGRVFVCSMADLFGKWVPAEWIEAVFESCLAAPEWQYMFLTKWPARYSRMPLIERAWYGASIVQQKDVSRVESAMAKLDDSVTKWISLEPMLTWIKFSDLSWCDLVVIGAQTRTTQPDGEHPAVSPEFDWVVDVVNQCREAGVPYYLKANLGKEDPGMILPKMEPRKR